MQTKLIGVIAILAALAAGYLWLGHGAKHTVVSVAMPKLSVSAGKGQMTFNSICAACHGENGSGSENGPPLIHRIYEPSHHGDHTFRLAVQAGVRAHHWRFGNMPPVPGVTSDQVEEIIAFVREVQRHNGIN